MEEPKEQNEMRELIQAIAKSFPPKAEGDYTCAVFFHHDKNGKLKTMSPLISGGSGEEPGIKLVVGRLLEYSNGCHQMANDMIARVLPEQ